MSERMRLARFCDYLGEQRRAIRAIYTEIEEVQFEFNRIYSETMQKWQTSIAQAVPLLAGEAPLPPALAQSLLQAVQQERIRLQGEIDDLSTQVRDKRAAGDQALQQAQAEVAALRRMNPELDAQEEALKARCAAIRQSIQDLDARLRRTGLLDLIGRYRLRRQRKEQQAALAAEMGRLRQVRQAWADQVSRGKTAQEELRRVWEASTVEAAQVQSRLDHLQENLERLSRQNGAGNLLAGLSTVPDCPEPLHAALQAVVELNRIKAEYEQGLRTVAQALGLLKGLAEGMERFQMSADKVLEEQERYNLRELQIHLSDDVLAFHALWPDFRRQVRDEKSLGAHPAEFSRRVDAIIRERLDDSSIAAVFDTMGQALTQATRAWD